MASEPSDSELLAVMQASIDADALTDVTYEHAGQSLYLIRKRLFERSEELARLRTALESAKADRQRAVDDLFAQLRVNESLRAEAEAQPLENIEGLTQAQPVCRASQGQTKNGED